MDTASTIRWTNKSVKAFAKNTDPITAVRDAARAQVLKAREMGWTGPPFNPLTLAKTFDIRVDIEANSSISDARLLETSEGAKIEFNPRQSRERVRFSIAHEIAHLLFPDWHNQIRNRSVERKLDDDWQLEMLCNIAASEFVLPIGSISDLVSVPHIEGLMERRREYDVSFEAFLIRVAKLSAEPIAVYFVSPTESLVSNRAYRLDYFVKSPTAPKVIKPKKPIPKHSIIQHCTAIGYTSRGVENWPVGADTDIECVGIPPFPGSIFPRVAVLARFDSTNEVRNKIEYLHGNILNPHGRGPKIICQLVNDRAGKWGGGVAHQMAKKYPRAEVEFSATIRAIPREDRLGCVVFTKGEEDITIASMVAQHGFGQSSLPRIRYVALKKCLESVAARAADGAASIHMPRIGTGAAGGDWSTIAEMISDTLGRVGLMVTIYDPPPRRPVHRLF